MFELKHLEIRRIMEQLDAALASHETWFQHINRTLACHTPCETTDLSPDAHRQCNFGAWYYRSENAVLRKHDGFIAIEQEHTSMHRLASALLLQSTRRIAADIDTYDQFSRSVERLHLQIHSLQRELQDSLFNRDPLTGARTRSGMLSELRRLQQLSKRKALSCCIAMLDVDHFKRINDRHGHQAGDRVLKTLVDHLLSSLRPYDTVFRYGGEEFLICLPGTDLPSAYALIERLRLGIAQLSLSVPDLDERVTGSFGISALSAGIFVEESIRRADQALYQAKAGGRNCTVVWENLTLPTD